ncbi:single-stranded DNA-binding protein [Nonomuraea sp. NPDC050547]|uniref:single-stranded DNA-binding protein n=1 Tax=Nonomuraea sp. NPDC050547 TaxID=3364368 RepID=UPI0037AFA6E6
MTTITFSGNLTRDAEYTITPSGTSRLCVRLADTPRHHDPASGEWKDGATVYLNCTAWRTVADDIAEAELKRGARVIVTGKLIYREWESAGGEKREGHELVIQELARSVRGLAKRKSPASADTADEPPF